jgi:trigger factor
MDSNMDFESSVEDIDAVTKKVVISIPQGVLTERWEKQLNKMTKSVRLNGFREGKAPKHLVEKMHGTKVKWDVLQEVVNESLSTALTKHDLATVGRPSLDMPTLDKLFEGELAEPFSFSASVAIMPAPKIVGYESFKTAVKKEAVGEAELDAAIERMRESRAKLEPVTDREKVSKKDVVALDVQAAVKGEALPNPEPVMFDVEKGGNLPEEVKKKIAAAKKGATIEIEVEAGDDHPVVDFRGKTVQYKITVKDLSQKILPELNDEFWKTVGKTGEDTVPQFREKLKEVLEKEAKDKVEREIRAEVIKSLVEKNEFIIPQVMVDEEIRSLFVRLGMVNPKEVNVSEIDVAPYRETFGPPATNLVKEAIILHRIGLQEKLTVSADDLEARMGKISEEAGVDIAQVKSFYSNEQRTRQLAAELEQEKIWKFLRDRTKV